MKKALLILLAASAAAGCATQSAQTTNTNQTAANTAATAKTGAGDLPPAIASHGGTQPSHSDQTKTAPTIAQPNADNSGAPGMMTGNATAIDTAQFDSDIAAAEKQFKAKPADAAAKTDLAEAYATRAFALTEAAQYRAALGDFRRALKLNPKDAEAQKMHDQIISIFKSLNRDAPKEGEEPAPLPFSKEA